ncbi:MAG: transcription termination factor NusB [Moritella dasanensis]|jgi:transcription termination factor NusB
MAEKKLTNAELDQVGLPSIEIDWDNKQKLTALFHHYAEKKEPLPAYSVNDNGDAMPNLSHLARLAKVIQGKQVFKRVYARELLDAAIKALGIEDLNPDEKDETQTVREYLQSSIDSARRSTSDIDKKLKEALNKIAALTDENQRQAGEITTLTAKLTVAGIRTRDAEKRVIKGVQQERKSLKRVFG